MKKVIYNSDGIITGLSADPREISDIETDIEAPKIFDYMVVNGVLTLDVALMLGKAKEDRLSTVKRQVVRAILDTNWRLERAIERGKTGADGETEDDVLLLRESLRRASNRVELLINKAVSVDAVNKIIFEVIKVDKITKSVVTRIDFMRRFTDAEMTTIVEKAKTVISLSVMLLKWQSAEAINLNSNELLIVLGALETAKILKAGRAKEIVKH